MTGPKEPQKTDSQKERRVRRLSAALRDNLKRRKAQARGRSSGPGGDCAGEPGSAGPSTGTHDSAEFAKNNKRNS